MQQKPLFGPTYRLVLYSLLMGVLGALVALAFEQLVDGVQRFLLEGLGRYDGPFVAMSGWGERFQSSSTRLWLPLATTLGGLVSGFIVYRWAPEAEGHGTDAAIEAYHQEAGQLRPRVPLVKAVSSALTLGSGGVAGKEGPTAQITVGLGSVVGGWAGLRGLERRALLQASMAAGLAAIFRAPLGMAIFSVEVLYSGMAFESEALIYTLMAAVTSYAVYGFFAGWEPLFDVPGDLRFDDPLALLSFAVLGLMAGVLGVLLPMLLYRVRSLFRRLPGPPHLKPAIGGLVVGIVAVVFPEVVGAGYEWVTLAMGGTITLGSALLILALKAPAMSVTIGSGGSGGVFGPCVTMGALLGAVVGLSLEAVGLGTGIPVAAFVVVGMAALFSGAARTPVSTLIMVAEMTGGYGLLVPAMLACTLAFLVQRSLGDDRPSRRLYEAQVESRERSPLHRGVFVRRGLEILDAEPFDVSEMRLPRLVSLLRFGEPIPVAGEQGLLTSLQLAPGCELDGQTVAAGIGGLRGATAVAILREEEMLMPRGGTLLAAGDQLLVVTTADTRASLEAASQAPVRTELE